jgi:hypothetical protein
LGKIHWEEVKAKMIKKKGLSKKAKPKKLLFDNVNGKIEKGKWVRRIGKNLHSRRISILDRGFIRIKFYFDKSFLTSSNTFFKVYNFRTRARATYIFDYKFLFACVGKFKSKFFGFAEFNLT